MAKRARQAHIPKQQISRRKPRPAVGADSFQDDSDYPEESVFTAEVPASEATISRPTAPQTAAVATPTRTRRRLEVLQGSREGGPTQRSNPGGLPTFERAYLITELKTIAIISTSLLALILVLTVVLR